MDARKLSKEQRHILLQAVMERRDWLHRLHVRMRAAGWSESDPAYFATFHAHEAMHKLVKTLDTDPQDKPPDWLRHIGPE